MKAAASVFLLLAAAARAAAPGGENLGRAPDLNESGIPPAGPYWNETVIMRQFVVEATRPWRYATLPGCEVLSHCDAKTTERLVVAFAQSLAIQQAILPSDYAVASPVPITAILFDQGPVKSAPRVLVPRPVRPLSDDLLFWGATQDIPHFLGGATGAFDDDTLGMCMNLWGVWQAIGPSSAVFINPPILWAFRMNPHTPPFPRWLDFGVYGPFGLRSFSLETTQFVLPGAQWIPQEETDAYVAALAHPPEGGAGLEAARSSGGVVAMEPFIVRGHTTARAAIALLPMEELFRKLKPGDGMPSDLWLAQAALFVRWGLFEKEEGEADHRAAFLNFVARASAEPVTEDIFVQCFGFDYAEMESRLARYLHKATTEVLALPYQQQAQWPPALPAFRWRWATDEDAARIIGDWERMKADLLKADDPDLSRKFMELAGKTLARASGKGGRDPRFLAVMGLYRRDIGDDAEARQLLEAATQAGVVRPAAYFVLSQLRLAEAAAHPATPGGRFSSQQAEGILAPLFVSRHQAPLRAAAYELIANVWAHSAAKPKPADLAPLGEGVALYPRNVPLAYSAAAVNAQWGYAEAANVFIEDGLKFADGAAAKEFKRLRASLPALR